VLFMLVERLLLQLELLLLQLVQELVDVEDC
jgi:hypothetical protein